MNRETIFIVDAHGCLHRNYHAIKNLTNSSGESVGALYGFERLLSKLLDDKKAKYSAVCFDSPGKTFRSRIYPRYKANRKKTDEDLKDQLSEARRLSEALGFRNFFREGMEADDIIAGLARKFSSEGHDVVIISSDKDAVQLVGGGIRLWDGKSEKYFGEEWVLDKYGIPPSGAADYFAMAGDSSDNIPGAKGVGPGGARKLLEKFGDLERILAAASDVSAGKDFGPEINRLLSKIEASRENVLLSKKLVVPGGTPPEEGIEALEISEIDAGKLSELAGKLEFNSLRRRISLVSPDEKKPAPPRAPAAAPAFEGETVNVYAGENVFAALGAGFFVSGREEITPGDRKSALDLFSDAKRLKICHNIKEIMHFLDFSPERFSAENIFDLMIAHHLLRPSDRKADFSKVLLERTSMVANLGGDGEIYGMLASFGGIRKKMEKELKEKSLYDLYRRIELPLARIIYFMEKTGVLVRREALESLSMELARKMADAEKRVYESCGCEVNMNSPKQLSWLLYEKLNIQLPDKYKKMFKTKTGYSTGEDALAVMKGAHEAVSLIMEHREYSKLKSSFVDNLLDIISEDGRIHTNYEQGGTATGRFSSSRPNLQNIPVKSEYAHKIRKAFVTPENFVLVSADYSQIDLRVLAHLSGDENLTGSFIRGEDIHSRTAREVFGSKEVTPEMRKIAKGINFGIIYGQTPFGLAAQLDISESEAFRYIEHYFRVYGGVKAWIDKTVKSAEEKGYVATFLGRRRDIPELKSRNNAVRNFGKRVAVNTPVQGGSADIIKLAMINVFGKIDLSKAKMIMQVHDELIFEVATPEKRKAAETIAREMENAVKLKVPLKVEVREGTNWSEMSRMDL